jgi:hypothetical protein
MTLSRRVASQKSRIQRERYQRARKLRFDLLEERRLLAGLDVWVFDDVNQSRAFDSDVEFGVPRQVVYIDLNQNASHDRGEPLAITNFRGVASFADVQPGTYSIRLLGENTSRLQTSPVVPGSSGTLDDSVDIDEVVQSLGDSGLLGISGNRIQKLNLDGSVVASVEFPGAIIDSTWNGDSGLVLVDASASRQLYRWEAGTVTLVANDASNIQSVVFVGESYYLWNQHEGLVRGGGNTNRPLNIAMGGDFRSFAALGNDRIVVEEAVNGGTRLSVHQIGNTKATLVAERTFDLNIVSWQSTDAGNMLFVETEQGVQVLDVSSGLPTKELLQNSTGPILFDPVSNLVYTGIQNRPNSLQSWSTGSWLQGSSFPLDPQRFVGALTDLTLSHDGRQLIGSTSAGLYRQEMAVAQGLTVTVDADSNTPVSFGVSLVGAGTTLSPISLDKSWNLVEDESLAIDLDGLVSSSGGALHLVILTEPLQGRLEWSVETGGVYIPNPNAEGADSIVVAFFDGRNWSPSERIDINIQPTNDPPTGIVLPLTPSVSTNVRGGVIGPVSVDDIDRDSSYRWEVSDPRFEVQNGVLKLVENAQLNSNEAESIDLELRAIDTAVSENGDPQFTIQTVVSVKVKPNPIPSVLNVADQYTIPEKTVGVSLGGVSVSGERPASDFTISVSDSRFEVVNGNFRLRNGQYVEWATADAITVTLTATSSTGEQLSKNTLIRVIPNQLPNPYTGPDPDGDGKLTPIDVLMVVNYINRHGAGPAPDPVEGEPGGGPDVDGDGKVTPIDVLILVNMINQRKRAATPPTPPRDPKPLDGEGEAIASGKAVNDAYVDELAPDVRGSKRQR